MHQRADLGARIERMADAQLGHALRQLGDEFVVDRALHQQPARRGATLAVQAVDHEHDGIERTVEVGVVEHDDRILAAQFQVHALQRGRALRHDQAAGGRFADEADGTDRIVLRERAAGGFTDAVDQIHDAGRQPGFEHDLGQQACGQRAPFGRFVHHRAAGGQRRRDLPGRQHERRVPRRDHADRAERLAHRVVHVRIGGQRQAIGRIRRAIGEEAEVLGAAQRGLAHEAPGLAGIHALDQRDLVGALLDAVGHFVQQAAAFAAVQRAPGAEGVARRFAGCRHFGFGAAGHAAQQLAIDRRVIVEHFALAGHRLAVDQVTQRFALEARQVAVGLRQFLVEFAAHGFSLPACRALT